MIHRNKTEMLRVFNEKFTKEGMRSLELFLPAKEAVSFGQALIFSPQPLPPLTYHLPIERNDRCALYISLVGGS